MTNGKLQTQTQFYISSLSDKTLKRMSSIPVNTGLMSNAIKYRSPGGVPVVKISCHSEADYSVLTVEDNSLGTDLSEGKQEKLFGMFKRLHDHVEGSGIGLYMVTKMTENAGGKVEVESKEG